MKNCLEKIFSAEMLSFVVLAVVAGVVCEISHALWHADGGRTMAPLHALAQAAAKSAPPQVHYRNTAADVTYVGSEACASCHSQIFKDYQGTPHGQAASLPSQRPELKDLPPEGTTICGSGISPCFRVFQKDDGFYMREFQPGPAGQELFPETEKIGYVLGAPMAGTGYVIERGNYLFEAPLSFYSGNQDTHAQGWGLSPGYTSNPLGFTRPLIASCLYCHAGRLQSTADTSNRYKDPPFSELSIGCESCHGPGSLHVDERRKHLAVSGPVDTSIVNPATTLPRLANDTCNTCHELGEARIPQPGKSFVDFRPGTPLLDTEAIVKSKLLMGWNMEEWFDEMTLSKCYRASGGRLSCVSCHDAHVSPTAQQAPAYFRGKCMACHRENSCTLPLQQRLQTRPADNCIGCHMPKHVAPSFVMLGTNGTSHTIQAYEGEPLPTTGIPLPDPATGLLLIDSKPGPDGAVVPLLVLLQAYQSVLARHADRADLQERYNALLDRLAVSEPANVTVLSALGMREMQKQSAAGYIAARNYLRKSVDLGSQSPQDYIILAEILVRSGDPGAASEVLRRAITLFPYLPIPYEKLSLYLLAEGNRAEAGKVVKKGLSLFPADPELRALQSRLRKSD